MKWFGEKVRTEARNRALTNKFVCFCCIFLGLACVCLLRGFPEGLTSKRAGGSTTLGPDGASAEPPYQSLQLPVDASADGAGAAFSDPARGPPVKLDSTAATAVLAPPIDPQTQDSPDNDPTDFRKWSGTGVQIEFSTVEKGTLEFVEDFSSGVDPELDSTLGFNPAFPPPQSIPEPNTVTLFVLGSLITAWWKNRLRVGCLPRAALEPKSPRFRPTEAGAVRKI
jgi:hypothetical protein